MLYQLSIFFLHLLLIINLAKHLIFFRTFWKAFDEFGETMASNSGRGAPTNGSIYVCNLPEGTDETMLAEYFGTIGLLKV